MPYADLGGGFRKIRISIESKGKGKSGGARIITYEVLSYETERDVVLLYVYDKSDMEDVAAIRQLGEGRTGEEAWAISLYCALRHIDSMSDAIIAAVNHNGDSDSTGSITGNIMGAIYGYEAIKRERMFCPEGKEFEDTIELANIILALADDLVTGCNVARDDQTETPEQKQWSQRYWEMKPVGI